MLPDKQIVARHIEAEGQSLEFLPLDGIQTTFVDVEGQTPGRIACFELGDPGNPTLVLIHGWAESKGTWRFLLAELARDFHVYAVDLPGFGESDRFPDLRHCQSGFLTTAAQHLAAFMAAIKVDINDAVFVSHSMGGAITIELLTLTGKQPRALYLIAPMEFGIPHVPFSALPFVQYPLWVMRTAQKLRLTRPFFRQDLQKLVFDPDNMSNEYCVELTGHFERPGSVETFAAGVRASLKRSSKTTLDQVWVAEKRQLYTGIKCPTVIAWGKQDTLLPPENAAPFLSAMPDASLVELDRAAHIAQLDRPHKLLRLIRQAR